MTLRPHTSTLFPYTTLFRSPDMNGFILSQEIKRLSPSLADKILFISGILFGQSTVEEDPGEDRKSTRLNSSHITISYAVFCLKKKKSSQKLLLYHYRKLQSN